VQLEDVESVAPGQRRLAPRWSEIVLIGVGSTLLATGGGLWAIDSTCPGGVDPTNIEACPELYDTRGLGIAAVVTGGALLVTGIGLLTNDEIRSKRGARVQLVGTSLRF
jgi:hypothetical protein